MTKPDARRAEILERLADHVLAHGLSASSLRPLAKAAGTSDRMLLYYFADKAEMMTATLSVIAVRIMAAMEARKAPEPLPFDRLLPIMLEAIVDDEMWPFMRVWLEIASLAANGDAFYRAVGEQLGRGFLSWGAGANRSGDRGRAAQPSGADTPDDRGHGCAQKHRVGWRCAGGVRARLGASEGRCTRFA